jgi:hypothetical protein
MTSIDWNKSVLRVIAHHALNKNLKNRPKLLPFLDYMCSEISVTQEALMEKFELAPDGVATLLSNVTMAIQGYGSKRVWPIDQGGWYSGSPVAYLVNPDFSDAWVHWRNGASHNHL